jgi:hypothetical protein
LSSRNSRTPAASGCTQTANNTKAHALVNSVQRRGAKLLLGTSNIDEANTEPPSCAAM